MHPILLVGETFGLLIARSPADPILLVGETFGLLIARSPADPDRPCTHLSAHEYNTHLKSLLDKDAP